MPAIVAAPQHSCGDQPIAIELVDFPPHTVVEVRSARRDFMHNTWRAWARFETDARGRVQVAHARPLAGSYDVVSPMGLFWSMELVAPRSEDDPIRDIDGTIEVELTARVENGSDTARTVLTRYFVPSGGSSRWVRENGIVGRLFLPPGPGPHPSVVVLSGSSGGFNLPVAALLSTHGYATFALGYFGADGLPETLDRIPLEYFEGAMAQLTRQPEVDPAFVGVLGVSRGGELALLLGATYARVNAVVAYVPSSVVHSGLNPKAQDGSWGPAWIRGGDPVPWLQEANQATDNDAIDWGAPPFTLRPVFESSMRDPAAMARAAIPVERIEGPVMLVSGTDDRMWPSARFARQVERRLAEHRHAHEVMNLIYPGAGHRIFPPYAPTTQRYIRHGVLGVEFDYGGSPLDDARACMDSWPKVCAFLDRAARR